MTQQHDAGGATADRYRLNRRHFVVASAGVLGALLLEACGGKEPVPQAPENTGTSQPIGSLGGTPSGSGTGTGTAAASPTTAAVEHQQGGVLKVAMIGEPPSVADAMFTTTTVTANITRHIFEGLFAQDSKYSPQPMLVDRYTVSPDGLNYEFGLRQGVTFHNGKELTADDVVASLKRWGLLTGRGKMVLARLADNGLQAKDPRTVTLTFQQPTGVLLDFLARTEAFIMPAEVADAAGKNKLADEQTIGTGPFMFKEHQVDRLIRLVRYDGYQPRSEAPDGLTGRKVAYVDELQIIPVPDVTVATNGVLTGEYHFADTVENDQFDIIKSNPDVEPVIVKPGSWLALNFQKAQGLFTDKRLRQAVALAFDRQQALIAAFGLPELTRLDPGIAALETVWHSDAGKDVYEEVNPDKARQLLQEAGYNGQTARWLTTKEYPYHYNPAAYIKQQLEAIGMKVELVVTDWATVVQQRAHPEAYELLIIALDGVTPPAAQLFNDKTWPGFWDDPRRDEIVDQIVAETDPAREQEHIDAYQQLIYDELPFIKIGDFFSLQVIRKEVQGFDNTNGWHFWNTSLGA